MCLLSFLNILALVVFALFPMAHKVTEPRTFLPFFLREKLQERKVQKERERRESMATQQRNQSFAAHDKHSAAAPSRYSAPATIEEGLSESSVDSTPASSFTAGANIAMANILPPHLLKSDYMTDSKAL
jgi:hypothetical protein